jgi:hypothetical protein
MGVRVDHVSGPLNAEVKLITEAPLAPGKVAAGSSGYLLTAKFDASYKAVNLLQAKGVAVSRIVKPIDGATLGDFLVAKGSEADIRDIAKSTGVDLAPAPTIPADNILPLKQKRIGLYQHYYGGNVDEGWTRWLLEQWGYNPTSLLDPELKKGDLNAKFDVIVIPDDSTSTLTGETGSAAGGRRGGGGGGEGFGRTPTDYAPEYRSGFGEEGVTALKSFVQKGGTIVTLGTASDFAIEKLGVHARNIVGDLPTKQFWCPGSTLKVDIDPTNPLGYGMPKQSLALYLQGDPVFQITPSSSNERYSIIVSYEKRDILQSGWLVGEGNITGKAAMISAEMGKGKVILIGFRAQHRAQTYGTFKLFFNSLTN